MTAEDTVSMDVDEKKSEDKKSNNDESATVTAPKQDDIATILFETIKEQCTLLEKGENHALGRVLRTLAKTRKHLTADILRRIITTYLSSLISQKDVLLKYVGAQSDVTPMDIESSPKQTAGKSPRPLRKTIGAHVSTVAPEVEVYIHLLVVQFLVDQKRYVETAECIDALIVRIDTHDKRTLEPIAAKAFFQYALVHERTGRLSEVRSYFHDRLRVATLRHASESQAVLINCLLRSYLLDKKYQAAAKFVSMNTFPAHADNNEMARFLYYQGRIKAMQLDYSAAAHYLLQAMRKAPQESGIGFKQNVQKWTVFVSLLQGDIPERSVFRVPIYRKTLAPYLELTQAVRLGDLIKFNATLEKYGPTAFESDETITLVVRLRQNVFKTALRQMCTSYSRISLEEVRKKLQLSTIDETEYVIAKAIKDGAIEAKISTDTVGGRERYMQSTETPDVYRTTEPQYLFDNRIRSCLELHNQAVKALRYPPKSYAKDVESIEEQREREQQELEFAKEMGDEDDEDF